MIKSNASAQPTPPELRLGVKGLSAQERRLLQVVVRMSEVETRGGMPRIKLVGDSEAAEADVLLIDTQDPDAIAWANRHDWWMHKPVIWLDASRVPEGHLMAKRPMQWTMLPELLARALESRARASGYNQLAPMPQKRPSLLLVDDSSIARTKLRSFLALRGCDTTEAASVQECLAIAAHVHFDMVFMDVEMPNADGYEGCRRIKGLARAGGSLPVVMLTSKSSPFDRIRGKIAGCDSYMTKPIDATRLDKVLAQFAPGSHALASLAVRQSRYVARPPAPTGTITVLGVA